MCMYVCMYVRVVCCVDGKRLPVNRRQRVFPNGTIFLENVQREPDGGEYRCTAEHKLGRTSSQHFRLSVIGNYCHLMSH